MLADTIDVGDALTGVIHHIQHFNKHYVPDFIRYVLPFVTLLICERWNVDGTACGVV
jgi:hypothetical protein